MSLKSIFAWLLVFQTAFYAVLGKALPARGNGPRKFELTLTWEKHAPDGFEREMILVNGQFPGPLLELNQGDDVEIVVHNKMPYNTTIHCHGMGHNSSSPSPHANNNNRN